MRGQRSDGSGGAQLELSATLSGGALTSGEGKAVDIGRWILHFRLDVSLAPGTQGSPGRVVAGVARATVPTAVVVTCPDKVDVTARALVPDLCAQALSQSVGELSLKFADLAPNSGCRRKPPLFRFSGTRIHAPVSLWCRARRLRRLRAFLATLTR